MIRLPCVSGMFYENNPDYLMKDIEKLFSKVKKDNKIHSKLVAGIVPHAGYIYSGKTACYTFNEVRKNELPDTFIILGPNHTGYGTKIDVCDYEKWETPLGLVDVDTEFIQELLNVDSNVYIDNNAHVREHSIEVELPFLQYICEDHDFKIVPIVISQQIPQLCEKLAESLDTVINKLNRNCVIIASTDLNHYDDQETTTFLDNKIIKSVESMDMNQMIKDIIDYDITMCGYGPVITAICYSKLQNANSSIVLNHTTSGDTSGDYDNVVGYMSSIITE
jgi:AmmeMemoRadiSam system protein B